MQKTAYGQFHPLAPKSHPLSRCKGDYQMEAGKSHCRTYATNGNGMVTLTVTPARGCGSCESNQRIAMYIMKHCRSDATSAAHCFAKRLGWLDVRDSMLVPNESMTTIVADFLRRLSPDQKYLAQRLAKDAQVQHIEDNATASMCVDPSPGIP